jgi:hypothetical protein
MDISWVSDGWSHAQNPGRLPGRSGQRLATTATTTSKSSRGYGSANRTSQSTGAGTQNQQCQQSRGGRDETQVANYQDFFSTQPPLFSKVEEPLMPMLGFVPLNPSLHFLRFHVRTLARLTSLPNNYAKLPVSGGITIVPCKLMAMLSPRKNFGMLSEHIIYPKD